MTVIYIRHANDDGPNPAYPMDPEITSESHPEIRKLTLKLIRKYGAPDIIYISPMSRAIETYYQMKSHLGRVKALICQDLSRFFTRSEIDSSDLFSLNPRTFYLGVPLCESKQEFRERVDEHIAEFSKKGHYDHLRPVIWCITHTMVMKRVSKSLDLPLPSHLDFLAVLPVLPKRRKLTQGR